jgi:DNA polymerase III epsilon subunit-like protein
VIVFDNETTGLVGPDALPIDKQCHIIEFAAVKLDKNLKEIGTLEFMANPGIPLTAEIVKITGIRDSDLKDKKPFGAHIHDLQEFFLGERELAAHNCEFDASVLRDELRRAGKEFRFPWPPLRLCTVELTTHLKGHRLKLGDLYAMATKGKELKGAHRAINDVRALCDCIRWMRKEGIIE